ncbi:MAG: class I SAM-dependent methyltransferase [Candidatus Cloacimonetes bacterium]|nr:class I SAM-dependent methyltransferase [Candidatus Cloacimonadota bacterium]
MDIFAPETWAAYDPDGLIALRLEQINRILPPGVKTILDAGCGNGVITNALHERYDVTGLDLSPAALEYVKAPKVIASVTAIPFPDASFDLVMCNEVLEHLSGADLAQAVTELKRCSARYLLVSVPNREQLETELVRCQDCGHIFHAYGHLQSFDLSRLDFLLGWQRIWDQTLGPRSRDFSPALLSFRQKVLQQWFKPDLPLACPNCQSREFMLRKNLLTKAVNALGRLGRKPRPYWLMAMYKAPSNRASGSDRDHPPWI